MTTSLGSCCITGVIHEGSPKGSVNEINGTKTYVSLPTGEYDKSKALLFLTDAFGIELINNKLLADSFAANGIATYTGYCFGGRYVVELAWDKTIKVGAVAHPSLLEIPKDLQKLKKTSTTPILWNIAEKDYMFTTAVADQADQILGGNDLYKRIDYAGVEHGFAVRGDLSQPHIKESMEAAFKNTVEWIRERW
ncbi:hypothetical protein T439DRAFT_325541 [Meredithblackwellia eburnea MCA 4105]